LAKDVALAEAVMKFVVMPVDLDCTAAAMAPGMYRLTLFEDSRTGVMVGYLYRGRHFIQQGIA